MLVVQGVKGLYEDGFYLTGESDNVGRRWLFTAGADAGHFAVRRDRGYSRMTDVKRADFCLLIVRDEVRQCRRCQDADRDCEEYYDRLPLHEATIGSTQNKVNVKLQFELAGHEWENWFGD